jgi:hypothetical protein
MPNETLVSSINREFTSRIVAAYVRLSKSRPINSRPRSRRCMRSSPASANRHEKAEVERHPRCRSVDQFTAIMSSASNAAYAARRSDAISLPAID